MVRRSMIGRGKHGLHGVVLADTAHSALVGHGGVVSVGDVVGLDQETH